jgi:hypothetical protein
MNIKEVNTRSWGCKFVGKGGPRNPPTMMIQQYATQKLLIDYLVFYFLSRIFRLYGDVSLINECWKR